MRTGRALREARMSESHSSPLHDLLDWITIALMNMRAPLELTIVSWLSGSPLYQLFLQARRCQEGFVCALPISVAAAD